MKTKSLLLMVASFIFVIAGGRALAIKGKSHIILTDAKSAKMAPAVVRKLEYDFAKANIRKTYYENLDQLAKFVLEGNYAVTLRGHADSIGRYKANWVLSDKRAIEVKNYLVEKGIAEDRIITTPFGSTQPIATNKTAAGRQKNRRVEVQFKKVS